MIVNLTFNIFVIIIEGVNVYPLINILDDVIVGAILYLDNNFLVNITVGRIVYVFFIYFWLIL